MMPDPEAEVKDTTIPMFVSMYPPGNATDVPTWEGLKFIVFFTEPVTFAEAGRISFINGTEERGRIAWGENVFWSSHWWEPTYVEGVNLVCLSWG